MAYEQKDSSFSAFKAEKKAATHADYTGSAKVGGVDMWVNIWVKKDKNGQSYLSGSLREKVKSENRPAPDKTVSVNDFEDDIPF